MTRTANRLRAALLAGATSAVLTMPALAQAQASSPPSDPDEVSAAEDRTSDPAEIVARLKAERESAYALAPIHITSKSGPHGETANRILQELAAWL